MYLEDIAGIFLFYYLFLFSNVINIVQTFLIFHNVLNSWESNDLSSQIRSTYNFKMIHNMSMWLVNGKNVFGCLEQH